LRNPLLSKQLRDNLEFLEQPRYTERDSTVVFNKLFKLYLFLQLFLSRQEKTTEGISKLSSVLKDGGEQLSESASKVVEEMKMSETFKKGQQVSEDIGKSAQEAFTKVKEQSEEISKTEAAKTVTKV
jgi:hypothetical protein